LTHPARKRTKANSSKRKYQEPTSMTSRVTSTTVCMAALVLLLLCAPPPPTALAQVQAAASTADPAAPLVAAVSLTAWALTAWLLIAVLLTVLGRAPGRVGRLAGTLVRRWAPTAVRRAVELTLGLTVATGVLGAGTGHAAGPSPGAAASAPLSPSPAASPAPSPEPGAPHRGLLDLDWPTSSPPPPRPSPSALEPVEQLPPPARPAPPAAGAAVVVVRPGDTLWDLADAALRRAGEPAPSDARIAQEWPRWWAANRDVIGPDPDLILPGMQLTLPAHPAANATSGS
jgi:nucleoid-associated protein YgaU